MGLEDEANFNDVGMFKLLKGKIVKFERKSDRERFIQTRENFIRPREYLAIVEKTGKKFIEFRDLVFDGFYTEHMICRMDDILEIAKTKNSEEYHKLVKVGKEYQ